MLSERKGFRHRKQPEPLPPLSDPDDDRLGNRPEEELR